jgi:hypothetical protein
MKKDLAKYEKIDLADSLLRFLKKFSIMLAPFIVGGAVTGGGAYALTKEQEKKHGITNERFQRKLKLGHFDDPKIQKIRDEFIEENKDKLDKLTNESVRKKSEDKLLLRKALDLGYIPKNITFK